MNQLDLLQSISKYFARFSEQVKILNSNHEFHINIQAENMLIRVLNIVYDLNLRNLNQSSSGNYSAIDLIDDEPTKRIAFQVTSTNSIEKVKDCIQKFFRNGVYKEADQLNLYILTNKQRSYSKQSIQKKITKEIDLLLQRDPKMNKKDIQIRFSSDISIIDKTDLYKKLNKDNDLDKIIQLEHYIKKQYGLIEEKEELSNYYRVLKDMYYDTVMGDEKGMTLDQIYIQPSFSILHSAFVKEDERFINKEPQKFYDADPRYKIHEFVEDVLKGQNPLLLNKHYRLILILGYPGQGKSSFCKKFINDHILIPMTGFKPVFFFPLRNIRQVREFIYNPLSILYDEACSFTEQNLNKSEFNKSLLILDGLDELYMRENLNLDEIDRLCIELVRLVEKYNDLQIIVTSRYGYIDDEKLTKENILIAQLSSFKVNLQQAWLSKYQVYHPETWLSDKKLEVLNSDSKYGHIRELLEQPLLLHMVASVNSEIDENTNRAKIYSQLFNELIERKYAKEGQIEILKYVKKEDLRELIREVAFAIFETGNEYITKFELIKLPGVQSFLKLLPESNSRDSIKGIMISFYFKEIEKTEKLELDEDRSNYAIEFLHKSLREYMTAEKIFHSITEQFLDKRTNGKYIIDDPKTVLSLINSIFGKQDLSTELLYNLKQIINNSVGLDSQELVERMCLYMQELVYTDFLIEYRMDTNRSPLDISLRCFHGFWFFISCLGLKKNYLTNSPIKKRVAQYFKLLSLSSNYSVSDFDLSNQDFSNVTLDNVTFYNCLFDNTDFTNCSMDNVKFIRCKMSNVLFKDSYLDEIIISGSRIKESSFEDAFLGGLSIKSSILKKVNFSAAEIRWLDISEYKNQANAAKTKMEINECKFINTEIDEYSLKYIRKWYPKIEEESFIELKKEEDVEQSVEELDSSIEVNAPVDYKRIIFDENFI